MRRLLSTTVARPALLVKAGSSLRVLATASILGVVVLSPCPSSAFCRATNAPPTGPNAASYDPGATGHCWDQGLPLFWRNTCVGYSIQRIASRTLSYDDVSLIAATGFGKWASVSCPTDNGGSSRVSIDIRDIGPVNCGEIGIDLTGGPNQNVIRFYDDFWPEDHRQLALTKVQFSTVTGEIYGADMMINTHDFHLLVSDTFGHDDYDLQSVFTHEAGHFLGLAHSEDKNATMYFQYDAANTKKRELTSDDVAGICSAYRPDGDRVVLTGKVAGGGACDPTPKNGFATECSAPTGTCSRSQIAPPARTSREQAAWSTFTLTVAGLATARLRAKRAKN